MKNFFTPLLLSVIPFLVGCQKKKQDPVSIADDFESLTGKQLPSWSYVQTKEDFEQLDFFKQIYEQKKGISSLPSDEWRIPKSLHFIWIGPLPFPRESVENVRTWAAKHPDWTLYFWTDRARPLPVPGMVLRNIQDLKFLKLRTCFAKSDSYGEKSDLLRYEILYQEGGVYVDHDVKCFKSFDPLNKSYDFYCGIDMPYTSSLPACIHPTNNLIGARAGHPIFLRCMEMLAAQWDQIGEAYPGIDRDSVLNRVLHRTFWLFGEAVKQENNKEGFSDIVFPAYYFDAPTDALSIYARHLYSGLWHEKESAFEKMVRQRLMYLSKKSNKLFLFCGAIAALNLLGLGALFFFLKHKLAKQ